MPRSLPASLQHKTTHRVSSAHPTPARLADDVRRTHSECGLACPAGCGTASLRSRPPSRQTAASRNPRTHQPARRCASDTRCRRLRIVIEHGQHGQVPAARCCERPPRTAAVRVGHDVELTPVVAYEQAFDEVSRRVVSVVSRHVPAMPPRMPSRGKSAPRCPGPACIAVTRDSPEV